MRGSIVKRHKGSYSLVLDLGYVINPTTGLRRRSQKWVTFTPTPGTHAKQAKEQAQKRLTELLHAHDHGEFIEPTKLTVGEWLARWLTESVKPSKRPSTFTMYELIVRRHLAPALGNITLQALRPGHIQQYHAERRETHSPGTLQLHHAVISGALKSALRQGLVSKNVATLVDGRPQTKSSQEHAKAQAWTVDEARAFLAAAKDAGPQYSALFTLAVDSGMRKSEIAGLGWKDVDLDAGTVLVDRQLVRPRRPKGATEPPSTAPLFGPTKSGKPRKIDVSAETVLLLREHKRHQATLKMKNRKTYADHGLVFAREWTDLTTNRESLGCALDAEHLGRAPMARLVQAAKVKPITFHGLRHTCATLLLGAGVPVHVVSQRLGHAKASITSDVYAHVVGTMQQAAAAKMGGLLANR